MDSRNARVRSTTSSVKIGDVEFDNNVYDEPGDVLYLHAGDPANAVDWGSTAEDDGTSYGADGSLVGMTILNAKWRYERDGRIEFTLPDRKLVAADLGDVFDHPAVHVRDVVRIPGPVELGGIVFDDVEYERRIDILYLRSSRRRAASDGASAEAFYLQFDRDGDVVAVTIAGARRLLGQEGKIVVTLPDGRVLETADIGPALAVA
jgi:uncharacterized protein YuzE